MDTRRGQVNKIENWDNRQEQVSVDRGQRIGGRQLGKGGYQAVIDGCGQRTQVTRDRR